MPEFRFDGAGGKVDVCQCVQFIQNNVDIIGPDTVGKRRDALPFIGPGDGVELAARHFAFFRIEVRSNGVHTIGIADHDNLAGKLFRFQMQVETTTIGIDNKFRRSNHCLSLLMVS